MNDRELLEWAAKAAGHTVGTWYESTQCLDVVLDDGCLQYFDPLNDDGDAFRLAVKLRITSSMASIDKSRQIYAQPPHLAPIFEPVGHDELAAVRRAIVRSAAEIGRNMK